jgi:hypothetical protein
VTTEVDVTAQDDGTGREEPRHDEPVAVPEPTSVLARYVRYDEPRRFFTAGEEYFESDVIEIDVETDAEFPIAGTGPALLVGEVPVIDSERVGERTYRFFAPASLPLEEGAPIALGRAGSGVPLPERESKLRFELRGGR